MRVPAYTHVNHAHRQIFAVMRHSKLKALIVKQLQPFNVGPVIIEVIVVALNATMDGQSAQRWSQSEVEVIISRVDNQIGPSDRIEQTIRKMTMRIGDNVDAFG